MLLRVQNCNVQIGVLDTADVSTHVLVVEYWWISMDKSSRTLVPSRLMLAEGRKYMEPRLPRVVVEHVMNLISPVATSAEIVVTWRLVMYGVQAEGDVWIVMVSEPESRYITSLGLGSMDELAWKVRSVISVVEWGISCHLGQSQLRVLSACGLKSVFG